MFSLKPRSEEGVFHEVFRSLNHHKDVVLEIATLLMANGCSINDYAVTPAKSR